MPRRLHIWSEFVPYDALQDRAILSALAAREVRLTVAVTPRESGLARVIGACRDAGVSVAIWPMLANEDGRWVSAANASRFCAFVRATLRELDAAGVAPDELALDLEPPIDFTRRLLRGQLASVARSGAAVTELRALTTALRARAIEVSAAIVPFAVIPGGVGWQRLLGTPADALRLDRVSTMAYTTLIQGYSRGAMRRDDARWLLFALARATRERYGDRGGISLGTIGVGALGNESVYRSPAELVEDVALARAAGVADLALFNLGGALARPPLERWLDALADTSVDVRVQRTLRASAAWWLAAAAGGVASVTLRAD